LSEDQKDDAENLAMDSTTFAAEVTPENQDRPDSVQTATENAINRTE